MRHLSEFRLRSPAAISTVLLAAVALVAPGRARADLLPDPLGIHHEVRGLLRDLAHVPLALHHQHLRHLEVFFGGNVYYAPHRHLHASYAFPVWLDGAVVYQPYAYCGGRLFAPPRVRPALWREWASPRAAHWCGRHRGYYPSVHGCFHHGGSRHSYDRGRTYHDRRDWNLRYRDDRRDRYRHDSDRGRERGHRHDRGRGHDRH
jgi:hypothetical protein